MPEYCVIPTAALSATADAIKAKTGSAEDIEFTQDGFADAIEAIPTAPVARGTGANSLIEIHTTTPNIASEATSVAIGGGNQSIASGAVTIGTNNVASAQNAVAIGSKLREADPNTASAPAATALGLSCLASGYGSVAVGYNTTASNTGSFSSGYQTTSSGEASITAGYLSTASGTASAAIGQQVTASATTAVAMGRETTASGSASIAVGRGTTASSSQALAAGRDTKAEAIASTALGYGTDATGARSLVVGAYNEPDANDVDATHGAGTRKYLMIVGNGTADTARSNAATLDWDGNLEVAGNVVTKDGSFSDLKEVIAQGVGLSYGAKQALLACFRNVAWVNENGQQYYNDLETELFPPNNLKSISAVFDQGNSVIYDTDSLNSIKKYLTVIATFSDSTTAVITNYLLSGELSPGVSTITVNYGGKSATFNANVTYDDSADWDYVWKYTDGLPPTSEWSYSTSGGSVGFVKTIADDGLHLGSKSGTRITYKMDYAAPSILSAGGGTAEFTFFSPTWDGTQSNKWYLFSVAIGDGTNGLRVKITRVQNSTSGIRLTDSSDFYNGTLISNFTFDSPCVIKLEMNNDTKLGRVYINGAMIRDNIDLTTIIEASQLIMYTGGVSDSNTSTAHHIVVQSVKIKYGVPEGLEATP